jgi:hypothetical protein
VERFRKGWYDRLEVPRVNLDWVKMNCKFITPREIDLLKAIHYRRLVRRDHLEVIVEGYRNIPNRTTVINRSIGKLFDKMCLDKVHEMKEEDNIRKNSPAIVCIDKAGAILLNVPYKQRIQREKKVFNDKEYLFRIVPSNYHHYHGINQLEVDTIELCLSNNFKLITWDLDNLARSVKIFTYNKEKIILKPDIFTIIKNDSRPFMMFIEYDTGTENRGYNKHFPTLSEKLDKYRKYMLLEEIWKSEWWYKNVNFPLLLFVTEDEKRIPFIKEEGEKLGMYIDAILPSQYKEKVGSLI